MISILVSCVLVGLFSVSAWSEIEQESTIGKLKRNDKQLTEERNAFTSGRGWDITKEADDKNSGYLDLSANLEMTLINHRGDKSKRKLVVKTLEGISDGDKILTVFTEPKVLRGTAFLTHSMKIGNDDQWIYLPAIKRIKKISSKNKRSPFFGSEFSFEDLASPELEKYRYDYLREELYEGVDCHVINRFPVNEESAYSRLSVWMDKEHLQIRKVEYFDRNGALLKTLSASGYSLYHDKFWRASDLYMVNHQNGKKTVMTWKNYKFSKGLSDSDFKKNTLKRLKKNI